MLEMKIARYDAVVATGIAAQGPCEAAPLLGRTNAAYRA
jgi:hypothetical protein